MRRLVPLVALGIVLSGCQASATPLEEFCNEAGSLLSREDFGPEPEVTAKEQMVDLTQLAQLLPEEEQGAMMELIGDLQETLRAFENGQAVDGWSSMAVVEHVGSLCDRDDLSWYMVVP